MDLQRNLLFVAIAIVSYMLLLAWMDDYGTGVPGQVTQEQVVPGKEMEAAEKGGAGEIPREAVDNNTGLAQTDNELPEIDKPAAQPVDEPEATVSGDFIDVHTDVVHYRIDLGRGDFQEVVLKEYPVSLEYPDNSLALLENNSSRVYVAQSGLIGPDGPDRKDSGRDRYTTTASEFSLDDQSDELVVDLFLEQENNVSITKRFTFTRSDYDVKVEYLVDNQGNQPWNGVLFGQIKRDNSTDPSASGSPLGMVTYLGAAYGYPEEPYEKHDFDDFRKKPLNLSYADGWIAMLQHYFVAAWVPDPSLTSNYKSRANDRFNYISFTTPEVVVQPGQQGSVSARFYAGPKIQHKLEALSGGLELTVDYGWLWMVAQLLFWLLIKIHAVVGNWGISIILLTVVVKAAFFWFSAKGYKSMAKMRQVTPEINRIRAQYKDDRQKQSQAMMELYKKKEINPLGGCFPILIQMPVFLALYWVLMESVELRQAPFFLWIHDLSIPDPYFVLPLLMGASMFLQTRLNPAPPDPTQAMVMKWMPVIFTVFFLFFPAGLVLYWVVNNILSIAQQWVITRNIEAAAAEKS